MFPLVDANDNRPNVKIFSWRENFQNIPHYENKNTFKRQRYYKFAVETRNFILNKDIPVVCAREHVIIRDTVFSAKNIQSKARPLKYQIF